MKQYYVNNSNKLKEQMKQWKTNTPEYYKEYNKSDKYKQYQKQYRENKKLQTTQEPQQAPNITYNISNLTINN